MGDIAIPARQDRAVFGIDRGRPDRVLDRAIGDFDKRRRDIADDVEVERTAAGDEMDVRRTVAEHIDVVDDQIGVRCASDRHARQRVPPLPGLVDGVADRNRVLRAEHHVAGARVLDVVNEDFVVVIGQGVTGAFVNSSASGAIDDFDVDGLFDIAVIIDDQRHVERGRATRQDQNIALERDIFLPRRVGRTMFPTRSQRALGNVRIAVD